jgi:hypothetical protein
MTVAKLKAALATTDDDDLEVLIARTNSANASNVTWEPEVRYYVEHSLPNHGPYTHTDYQSEQYNRISAVTPYTHPVKEYFVLYT